jgi:hypothetical protein
MAMVPAKKKPVYPGPPIPCTTCMGDTAYLHYLGHLFAAVLKLVLIGIALPLLPLLVLDIPLPAALALMGSTFVIEYGAAPVGIGLGLHPVYVLVVLTCVAVAVTLFLFDIIDTLGEHSERVKGFLDRSAELGRKSGMLSKYGIYGLVPCVMTLGFYACPPVACVFGWKRDLSLLMIMAGYIGISIATVLLTMGIFDLFLR